MAQVWNIIAAILVLMLCVVVHEFGHFISALVLKIPVEEFSIGFGPKLWGFTRKEIRYSLRAVPLGGYVRYFAEEDMSDPRSFANQPAWRRLISILFGPIMNGVLALVMALCLFVNIGNLIPAPMIAQFVDGLPAQESGMQVGDMIVAANGEPITSDYAGIEKLNEVLTAAGTSEITFTVVRGDQTLDIRLTPRYSDEEQRLMVGIQYGYLREDCSFGDAVMRSWNFMWDAMGMMLDGLKQLFIPNSGAVDGLVGPVGTVQMISQEVSQGGIYALQIIMLISLNLGIINLLPIPGLDGARAIFTLIEMIRGKAVPPEKESIVHLIGLAAIMLLVLFITYKDILRLITGGTLG